MEVSHALSLKRENFIFPVVLTGILEWPAPFNALAGARALIWQENITLLEFSAKEELVEEAIREFCADQCLQYFPPETDLPRLPLRRRMYQELWGTESYSRSRKAQLIEGLFENCSNFTNAYRTGDLNTASDELTTLLSQIRREFPRANIYYPKIVKAVVDTERAANNSEVLNVIRNELLTLAKSKNKWIDGNLFAMLGNLDLMQGDPQSAIHRFEEALPYLSQIDPAIVHNMILAAVLAEDRHKLDETAAEMERILCGTAVARPRDLYRLHILHALILCISGQSVLALDKLRNMTPFYESDFDLVRQMLDLATDQARQCKDERLITRIMRLLLALEEITRNYSSITWIAIAQRFAFVAVEMGDFDQAVIMIKSILARSEFTNSIQALVDATLVFHASDEQKDARDCLMRARAVRELDKQSPPMSKSDFAYYRGLASWLAGRDEIAHEYFEDAGNVSSAKWYEDQYAWVNRSVLRL